jgi:hypothetical protein
LLVAVEGLEPPSSRVVNNERPGTLSLSHDHSVGMLSRLLGQECRMRPAEDNEPSAAAKRIGNVVNVVRIGGVARDTDTTVA